MSKADLHTRLQYALAWVRGRVDVQPTAGVILGSGLAGLAEGIEKAAVIPYDEIPGMPVPKVIGHPGRLVVGELSRPEGRVTVAALLGRAHAYEGHAPEDVAFGARLLCALGVKAILTTNAAGGINPGFQPGDLVRITDHLDLSRSNPLVGENDDRLGPRFPDLSAAYDPELGALLDRTAAGLGQTLRQGIYACVTGPSYETPAEVRMLRSLGADLVGMSTVPEVVAARHMGVRVAAVSCVTNHAAGLSARPLSHAEVEVVAAGARDRFAALATAFLVSAFG
ncbi:MAG: purine-nucleoside phosphorylase [Anaeromyxobacter sp.]